MTLIKWNPKHQQLMNHRSHSPYDTMFSEFFGAGQGCQGETCAWTPRADILETEKDFRIEVELPGLEKKDVSLRVEDDLLTISGKREQVEETEDRRFRRVERVRGEFQRRFRLPKEIELDSIKAGFENGLLTVTVPKSEKVAGREIELK